MKEGRKAALLPAFSPGIFVDQRSPGLPVPKDVYVSEHSEIEPGLACQLDNLGGWWDCF